MKEPGNTPYDVAMKTCTTRNDNRSLVHLLCVTVILSLLTAGCSYTFRRGGTDPANVAKNHKGPKGTRPYTIRGKTYYPLLTAHGFTENGIASWYGKDFHGKTTANGERYDMYGMTAAHKLLPFGTQVKVTNKLNGKSIIVRINDRGPFVSNRVIDLTKTGAERLGMLGPGTAPVSLQTIGTVPTLHDGDLDGRFFVQIGAFGLQTNAEGLVRTMQAQGTNARTYYDKNVSLWRVQAGPYKGLNQAEAVAERLKNKFPNSFIAAE